MKQPIAIVGASTRAAAASALRAGFLPVTADLFADADLRAIATTTRISPYPEGFVDWLRTIEPPAFMYTGALENHPELVDEMAWIAPLWGNPGDVLERVRSPWELAIALRESGLLFPETRPSAEGLPFDGSWLAKSYRGASGSGVKEWIGTGRPGDKETRRQGVIGIAPESPDLPGPLSPPLCYQRRIPGIPAAAVFVAAEGTATLLGITRQIIGEDWLNSHGFQYSGSIGPLPVDDATRATIERIGNVLAERFELTGLFGVDMMINTDGVWTIEVNPRYTASVEIVERATGIHALELHAAACTGNAIQRTEASSPPSDGVAHGGGDAPARSHGKATLFAKRNIVITEHFAESTLAEALETPWPTLADVSLAGTLIEAGRPILNVFAEGANTHEVERNLRQRVTELEELIYRSTPLP